MLATLKFIHVRTWTGRKGLAGSLPLRITGLAMGREGRLWAVGDRHVTVISPEGELIHRFDTIDAGWSIALDGSSVWIGMRGRIEQLDFAGKRLALIDEPHRLGLLTGLAAGQGRLLVGDATHKCLHLYRGGRFERRVGDDVNTRGFMIPNSVLTVAYDPQRPSFVVAHPQKHRIERYELDGKFAGKFGRFGHGDPAAFGGCCNPTTCAVTPAGLILASEKAPPRVKAFTFDGEFLAMTPDEGFDPSAKNQFLAADSTDYVYATDSARGTIEVFRLGDDLSPAEDGPASSPSSAGGKP